MSQTQLEGAFDTIIKVFQKYSVRVGDFDTLSKKEMAELMKNELPNFLKDKKNPKAIDEMFNDLDKNESGQLSFDEFLALASRFLIPPDEPIDEEGHEGHAHN
ncbi:protein S100-A12-like [Elgaria multicarinata webbii]|uniref:protein S100-A12-like n=1 Tax=Elgaria multicarinata webbii TaxID=159646 RepID=UPI002FCCBF88